MIYTSLPLNKQETVEMPSPYNKIRMLQDTQAIEVKGMIWNGFRFAHISRFYPVTSGMIKDIIAGRSYSDITWPDGTAGALPPGKRQEHFASLVKVRSLGGSPSGHPAQTTFGGLSQRMQEAELDIQNKMKVYNLSREEAIVEREASIALEKRIRAEVAAEEEKERIEKQRVYEEERAAYAAIPPTPEELEAERLFPLRRWEQRKSVAITKNALAAQDADPSLSVDAAVDAAKRALWEAEYPGAEYGTFPSEKDGA